MALSSWWRAVACVAAVGACQVREREDAAYVPDPTTATAAPPGARVVLVTIDGARWQDVFEGSDSTWGPSPPLPPEAIMPRAHELARTRGAVLGATLEGCGAVRTASGANMSQPGYREIFTAHPSRCLDNDCARVGWTVLDEASRRGLRVASIGSWDGLFAEVSGGSDVLVSVGRAWVGPEPDGPLADLVAAGSRADPYPGHGAYRPDASTIAIALEYLRTAQPDLLHIGLGDTDEYGHRADYAAYLDALRSADALVGVVADRVDLSTTTILVTPDHGRNANFRDHGVLGVESGRTFLFAIGDQVASRGSICPRRDVTLTDIAPTIATLLGLPLDRSEGAGRPITEIVARFE